MKNVIEFILRQMEKGDDGDYYFVAEEALVLDEDEIKELKKFVTTTKWEDSLQHPDNWLYHG